MLEQLINLIAPHECLVCKKEGSLLCNYCRNDMPAVSPNCYRCTAFCGTGLLCAVCRPAVAFQQFVAVTPYKGTAKDLIYRLKYGRACAAAGIIAQSLAGELDDSYRQAIVTHIPTANTRVRQRGYDQAEYIARQVAALSGLPYRALLARTGQQR
ncbi:MAG: hypothetical protein AAB834_00805, partial [Patescibacteria group bacterium]